MTKLSPRPATDEDAPVFAALERKNEAHWFGAPETDESEFRESFGRIANGETQSQALVMDDGRVAAFGYVWGRQAMGALTVDVERPANAAYDQLLPWLAAAGATELESLVQDDVRMQALVRNGWRRWISQFELLASARDLTGLPQPVWPNEVAVTGLDPNQHAAAVHRMIHEDADWAAVPGHAGRAYDDWLGYLQTDDYDPDQQVVAWRDHRVIGAALGRTFSDGTGWVWQLAVARDERGSGLGRALLLAALHRRLEAGATAVGLGVSAENRQALQLYLDVGLRIDREWVRFRPGPRP